MYYTVVVHRVGTYMIYKSLFHMLLNAFVRNKINQTYVHLKFEN